MAEAEVQKHTKKIISIFGNDKHTFWAKSKEFFLEIFTIVFAISLSIWFHERSEHNHQQAEVKEFLSGLKEDLLNDQKEMKEDEKSYQTQSHLFHYVSKLKPGEEVHADSISKYVNVIFSKVGLLQNNGRFEGFKSSGKIGLIEDKELQNDIMDFYQESIPSLLAGTDNFASKKSQLVALVEKNAVRLPTGKFDFGKVFTLPESQIISLELASFAPEIITRYEQCMEKSNEIINGITRELPEK